MDPECFEWVEDCDAPGVFRRRMGTFTERDVNIGLVRLTEGTRLRFGTEDWSEILFLAEGMIGHGDDRHEKLTAFGSNADEAPELLTALEPSEFRYVKLPTF